MTTGLGFEAVDCRARYLETLLTLGILSWLLIYLATPVNSIIMALGFSFLATVCLQVKSD